MFLHFILFSISFSIILELLFFILFYLVFNILLPHISLLFMLFPFSCRPPHFLSSSTLFRVSFSSLSRIAKEWKPMHFSLSLSLSSQSKEANEEANDANELDSEQQRREIENGWTGGNGLCESWRQGERGNGPRRVRQATRNSPA